MTQRPVLIVGGMRTGTSLVAELVHRLGWHVAPTIAAPAPPAWRSDWEDPVLSIPLLRGERPNTTDLEEYLRGRFQLSLRMGFGGRVACKSPYLVYIWNDLLQAFAELGYHGELRPLVIRTYRYDLDVLRSLRAHPQLSETAQADILRRVSKIAPDIEIGYEAAVERPLWSAGAIAQALGVHDDAAIRAAAALVGRPTEYPTCPPSSQPQERQPLGD